MELQEKLSPQKQRLIRGIFKRKIKEFDEKLREGQKNKTLFEKMQFGSIVKVEEEN